jgi:hypothetical protein
MVKARPPGTTWGRNAGLRIPMREETNMSAAIRTAVFGQREAFVAPPAPAPAERRAGLIACAMMAAGMLAGGSVWFMTRSSPALPPVTAVTLGAAHFAVPSALLRPGSVPGRNGRIDLALSWPDLGPIDAARAAKDPPSRLGDTVLVTVLPAEGPAPQTRLASLYSRFLEPSVKPGPSGLMIRRFRAGSPYDGEDVLFSPPDGVAFTARCEGRHKPGDVLQPVCIAEFRNGAHDIQVRFEPRLAEGWERIGDVLLPLVAGMAR